MPQMTGTQFLLEAIKLYPDARRVLLTAYADTETAITAINQIGLDHYLLKPWEPPTERALPGARGSALRMVRPRAAGLRRHPGGRHRALAGELRGEGLSRVATRCPTSGSTWTTTRRCASCSRRVHGGACRISRWCSSPTAATLVQPTIRELAEKIGLQTRRAEAVLRSDRGGRRAGGSRRRGVRRVGRPAHHPHRASRAGRPGRDQLEDRELPRVPGRRHRRRSRAPRGRPRPGASAPRSSPRRRRSRSGARIRTAR